MWWKISVFTHINVNRSNREHTYLLMLILRASSTHCITVFTRTTTAVLWQWYSSTFLKITVFNISVKCIATISQWNVFLCQNTHLITAKSQVEHHSKPIRKRLCQSMHAHTYGQPENIMPLANVQDGWRQRNININSLWLINFCKRKSLEIITSLPQRPLFPAVSHWFQRRLVQYRLAGHRSPDAQSSVSHQLAALSLHQCHDPHPP